jgi:VanZ family protein
MNIWVRTAMRYAGLALALYWTALFIGTHTPLEPQPFQPVPYFDKWLHVVGYAGLAFIAATAWRARRPLGPVQYALLLLGLGAYAALDEALQLLPFVGRNADVGDWVADMVGAVIGLALFTGARVLAHHLGWRVEDDSQLGPRSASTANSDGSLTPVRS